MLIEGSSAPVIVRTCIFIDYRIGFGMGWAESGILRSSFWRSLILIRVITSWKSTRRRPAWNYVLIPFLVCNCSRQMKSWS